MGSRALIGDMNTLKFSFNPYSVNNLTLLEGAAAMEDRAYFDSCRREIMRVRDWTAKELRARGFTVPDSRTNFVFTAAPGMTGRTYYEKLRARNILVRYFGIPRTENYVRITIGSEAQMQALLQATDEIMKEV